MKRASNTEKLESILEKKELDPTKEVKREKGDTLAIVLAAFTTFLPAVLLFLAALALLIWLFTKVNLIGIFAICLVVGVGLLISVNFLNKKKE